MVTLYVCLPVCVCVSVGHFREPWKTVEPIEMPFGELIHIGLSNYSFDGLQGRTNPFAAVRGDKMTMWPFMKIL